MKIILIMGLPGAGKTTLADELAPLLNAKRLNADEVRKAANDWDFSEEGRTRQAKRMADFALKLKDEGNYVIADFICPTPKARSLFPADYVVWVDTIKEGRFDDTNKMFVKPEKYDFHVTSQDAKNWAPKIFEDLKKLDYKFSVMNLLRSIILAIILLFPISNSFGAVVTLLIHRNLKMVQHSNHWNRFLIQRNKNVCYFSKYSTKKGFINEYNLSTPFDIYTYAGDDDDRVGSDYIQYGTNAGIW